MLLSLTIAYAKSKSSVTSAGRDVYKVSYFDVGLVTPLSAGEDRDQTVRLLNPTSTPLMCAMIYVFDGEENLQECCGCPISTNGIDILSVQSDLTANPGGGFPGFVPNASYGTIQIVSSTPNATPGIRTDPTASGCAASQALALTPGLLAWSTHVEAPVKSTVVNTSVEGFHDALLDTTEEEFLPHQCFLLTTPGSDIPRARLRLALQVKRNVCYPPF